MEAGGIKPTPPPTPSSFLFFLFLRVRADPPSSYTEEECTKNKNIKR